MVRKKFVRYLYNNGCIFVREGAKHSVFFNPSAKRSSTVPRHNEIDNNLAKKICQDLGIKQMGKRLG